jgi:hypothetical protein
MIRVVKRGLFVVALGALGLSLTRPVHADSLPKGEEILDRYITATGGKEAYEKIKNRVVTGKMKLGAQGIEGKITIYQAPPNKMLMVTEIAGFGKAEQGSDGTTAWERDSVNGPRVKNGEEKVSGLRDAVFDADVHWRKQYKKAKCVAEESVDGMPAYKVELTTPEGKIRTAYYDKKSNLMVKAVMTEKTRFGNLTVESSPSDYKKVDGILIPHKLQQKMAGQEVVIVLDKVEHNAKIPADRFDLPEDVKKLADKEKK